MSKKRTREDVEEVVKELIENFWFGIPDLVGLVKLPGLIVIQYLFFWNWKRLVDPDSWEVIVAGIVVIMLVVGALAWAILSEV